MKRMRPLTVSKILIFLLLCTFIIILILIGTKPSQTNNTTIPSIRITLADFSLDEINSNGKSITYPASELELAKSSEITTYTDLEIKGHGNSTWEQEKKSYQIKFKNKENLFGFGKAKKWILLTNYFDPSNLKNATAFYLESMLEQDYRLEGEFVNLFINDEYLGLYYLTEKVELGKNRIHLTDQQGILVEHEGLHAHLENTCYTSLDSSCLVIKDVYDTGYTDSAIQAFISKYDAAYISAKNQDYYSLSSLIDIESFAKYFLLSEITLNPDAFMSSYFFYMDGENDIIHVGPGWDFDLAFGAGPAIGSNYGINLFSPYKTGAHQLFSHENTPLIQDVSELSEYGEYESSIMYYLIRIPEFKDKVRDLFNQYFHNQAIKVLDFINSECSRIEISADINNLYWKRDDFNQSVDKLKDWIRDRLEYLEYYYGNRPEIPLENISES